MDTLVRGYPSSTDGVVFPRHSLPSFSDRKGHKVDNNGPRSNRTSVSSVSEGDTQGQGQGQGEGDFSNACLKYISQMLMEEEDLQHSPCMFHDCLALQAAEKSFYDVLGQNYPPPPNQHHLPFLVGQNAESPEIAFTAGINSGGEILFGSNRVQDQDQYELKYFTDRSILQPLGSSSNSFPQQSDVNYDVGLNERTSKGVIEVENWIERSLNESWRKKNHHRIQGDEDDGREGPSNKQQAGNYADESVLLEMFDNVLLCPGLSPGVKDECPSDEGLSNGANNKLQPNQKGSEVGRPRGRKKRAKKEVVDFMTLLTQFAQAVSSSDITTANEVLKRIRQCSSPRGDATQRLAHYIADALEARMAGTGMALYAAFTNRRISDANILKAYRVYVSTCPFLKMSYSYANQSIVKVAKNATTLHVIDFGIRYGFQWPCLIQRLSVRPGGPPKLRITGIEFPLPGFRPAERIEQTGRRLAKYCHRFKVPFEYNAIANKWDAIRLEDLKLDRDEVLVVNCIYRFRNVPDETVVVSSPRDKVLNLIKRMNPDMFIHAVLNGTYNASFFLTRFREALFHFSALFDMFDATAPREDEDRMLFEKEVFGRDAMNLIACEGTERVERPETYKQWQVRNVRAGFRQLPLDQEILSNVRSRVKSGYHKDFVVDENQNWMLQGWKGRIIYALSCWMPE